MRSLQEWKGDLYLAYRALIAHPLRKMFSTDERSGKRRFLDNYGSEGLFPMTAEDHAVLRTASRCIHCGLCDAFDLAVATLPRATYDGASLLPLVYSRSIPNLAWARAPLAQLREEQLIRAEAVCPSRVPLRRIAEFLKRKLAEVGSPPAAR
jgi:succinate dehydrogenase/fumarate reductase-like Fe-S protein